jgi:hypothetical protein
LGISIFACKDDSSDDDGEKGLKKSFTEQEYKLPDTEYKYLDAPGNRLYDRFYFIGWSKEGKAAYITEPADEATGYYFLDFIIIDTRTDEKVFEWTIDTGDASYEGTLSQTWEKNKELFSRELNKHKIYPIEADMKKFPLNAEGQTYSLSHDIQYEKHEYFPMDVVSRAEIFLQNETKKQKIFTKKYDADLKLNVKGTYCVLSPFSDDALLLIAEEQRGYEGPPHLIRLELTGFEFPED